MIDLTLKNEDKEKFIVDLTKVDEGLLITYADGHTTLDTMYTEHNHNVYRRAMIRQIENYGNAYLDKLNCDSFKMFVGKYTPLIAGIITLYFTYNVDIHLIIKILITIGIVSLNIANLIVNEIWCIISSYYLDKIEAYFYYKNNLKDFVCSENYDDKYLLPIEDIDKHDLSCEQVIEIGDTVNEFRNEYGDDISELKLTYTRCDDSSK